MVKVLCTITYDGSGFHGFQRQVEARTVQKEIEEVLFKIHKEKVIIYGSGRTDAKVHSLNQTFHFTTTLKLDLEAWYRAINALLPKDIYLKKVQFVNEQFHARYLVKKKEYVYKINVGEYNPIMRNYIYQYNHELDIAKMQKGAQLFLGKHDFYNFCSNSKEEKESFVKEIWYLEVIKEDNIITITICGSGFLRYMVRTIVGALIEIGASRHGEELITSRLDNSEENRLPYNANPEGLYLSKVIYEEDL